jgi:hypothetical protein
MKLPPLPADTKEKTRKRYTRLERLIEAADAFELQPETEAYMQEQIAKISGEEKQFSRGVLRAHSKIVNRLAQKEKLTPPKYYTNLWTGLGMGAFGVPMGVAFGTAMENMGLIGIGLPIGLAIGIAIGSGLDNKAKAEDRVLDVEQ